MINNADVKNKSGQNKQYHDLNQQQSRTSEIKCEAKEKRRECDDKCSVPLRMIKERRKAKGKRKKKKDR